MPTSPRQLSNLQYGVLKVSCTCSMQSDSPLRYVLTGVGKILTRFDHEEIYTTFFADDLLSTASDLTVFGTLVWRPSRPSRKQITHVDVSKRKSNDFMQQQQGVRTVARRSLKGQDSQELELPLTNVSSGQRKYLPLPSSKWFTNQMHWSQKLDDTWHINPNSEHVLGHQALTSSEILRLRVKCIEWHLTCMLIYLCQSFSTGH